MLIQLTDKCAMGCSHCMINCKSDSEGFMTHEILQDSVEFANKAEVLNLIISGGEPAEHPNFIEYIKYVMFNYFGEITIASNGMFVENQELKKQLLEVLDGNPKVTIQITNDKRFYPKEIKRIEHSSIYYVDEIYHLAPKGRAKSLNPEEYNIQYRKAPCCYNFRSAFKQLKSISKAIQYMETRIKFCSFGVKYDGQLLIGENCPESAFGNITVLNKRPHAYDDYLIRNIKPCNRCGLMDNLPDMYKNAFLNKKG